MRDRRARHLVVKALVSIFALVSTAGAQTVTTPAVKAGFLLNFAKFIEWPADALAPGQRLSLCVVGDNAVADALEQIIKGRAIGDHELTVHVVTTDGPMRSCHMMYTGLDAKSSVPLLEALKGASVFTVGDGDKFAESGGAAQLFVEKDRMRFAINLTSTHRARLTLSSKLLSLATIVKGERDVEH